jgi:anti-sigma B factor antagonist
MEVRPVADARTAPPVIRLAAEIDVTNSDRVHSDLAAACLPGLAAVIADLTQTTFCDSSGVRALVQVHKLAASQGTELRLVVTSEAVMRILELSGLTDILRIYPTIEAAIATAQAPSG